jgi:hypothetical protein
MGSRDRTRSPWVPVTTVVVLLLLGLVLLAWLVVSLGGDGYEYWWSTETAQIVIGVTAGCLIVAAMLITIALIVRTWRRKLRASQHDRL